MGGKLDFFITPAEQRNGGSEKTTDRMRLRLGRSSFGHSTDWVSEVDLGGVCMASVASVFCAFQFSEPGLYRDQVRDL